MSKNDVDLSIIKDKVEAYILKAVHADKEKIRDNSMIFKEGYLDSMGFIMLISFIEEEFGVKTADADLVEENFESINSICDFIDRKTKV